MHQRRRTWWRLAACVVVAGVLVVFGGAYLAGSLLIRPVRQPIGDVPEHPPCVAVSFPSESGAELKGWFARREDGEGGVVLMHGVRADRTSMLDRARFLYDAGYSVLLFDFQAHGESSGDMITFGALEFLDARAAVEYLRAKVPGKPIAVIGSSLGGAACLLGAKPVDVDALVLEAVYPDIRQAVENRLRIALGWAGPCLTPLLTMQFKPRAGIDLDDLRPVASIADVKAPIFIIGGELDQRTTLAESQRLFDAAPEPKELWVVAGARHVDFHRYATAEYERRVLEFLRENLRTEGSGRDEPNAQATAGASESDPPRVGGGG